VAKYTTFDQQSIIDLAIQTSGGLDGLFDLVEGNDVLESINDIVPPRTVLEVPELKINQDVFNYLNGGGENQIDINTGDVDEVVLGDFNDDFNDDFNI